MNNTTYADGLRHDWSHAEVELLYALPLNDLLFRSHTEHRKSFSPNEIQISTLLSIKTGNCSEDCSYCSQSIHHRTAVEESPMLDKNVVITQAKEAIKAGVGRFCMSASGARPSDKELPGILEMVREVKALGMETCLTMGMVTRAQTEALKDSGLDFYNHNLDTSPEFYPQIVSTRTYQERLDTLNNVRDAGISICSGGILGLGESRSDRVGLLIQLANLPKHPESVPINMLVRIEGTPLEEGSPIDAFELVRTVAVARVLMPKSRIRLSAGRESMSDELHALCFFAGANSLFSGERLLTTNNVPEDRDHTLFERLGLYGSTVQP